MFACKIKQNKYNLLSIIIVHFYQFTGQSKLNMGNNGLNTKRQRYNELCLLKSKIILRFREKT